MQKWRRRIRGAIGMGLTWAAAWFGAGMVMLLGLLLATGSTGADVPYPLGFGAFGFVAGVTFSGVLVSSRAVAALTRCPFHALQDGAPLGGS